MARSYVGLDVHSKLTAFVVQGEDGTVRSRGNVPTSAEGLSLMKGQSELEPGTRVGLETGTMAAYVARELQILDLQPVVVDAHEVRLKAHRPRQKSDRRDAFEICDGLRRDIYRSIVYLPAPRIQELRLMLSRRRHFVRIQSSEVIAAKHLLRSAGQRHLLCSLQDEAGWQKLLSKITDSQLRSRIEFHHEVWRVAGDQVARVEGSLFEQSTFFEAELRRLQTVPGVGWIVSLTVLASFWDPARFPTAKHAASYGGLVPSTDQTGDRDWHGHITKEGSPELRSMLCEAAHHARRKSHPLNPYFSSLCARRGYKMAVIAVAHRLCRILYAMLRDGSEFEISKLAIEIGPFERKIVTQYRRRRRAVCKA